MRLRDKVVLITGGGSGMGRLASLPCAREGARVGSVDVAPEAGAAATAEITGAGGQALFVAADVGREDQVRNAVQQAVARFGRLDVLYNNAGIFPAEDGSVVDLDAAVSGLAMTVNPKGDYLSCERATYGVIRPGDGAIVKRAAVGA